MNYLGHLVCAHSFDTFAMGNFVMDLVHPREVREASALWKAGFSFHLWLDHYTDHSAYFTYLRDWFFPTHGKYSPVAVDLVLDFFIAHYWYHWADRSYSSFCQDSFSMIQRYQHELPARIQPAIDSMLSAKWLLRQRAWEGWMANLARMDKRTRFPSKFEQLGLEVLAHFSALSDGFLPFWEDIRKQSAAKVRELRAC